MAKRERDGDRLGRRGMHRFKLQCEFHCLADFRRGAARSDIFRRCPRSVFRRRAHRLRRRQCARRCLQPWRRLFVQYIKSHLHAGWHLFCETRWHRGRRFGWSPGWNARHGNDYGYWRKSMRLSLPVDVLLLAGATLFRAIRISKVVLFRRFASIAINATERAFLCFKVSSLIINL